MRTWQLLATLCATLFADAISASEIVVRTSAELVASLSPANAGQTIRVAAGEYLIDAPLQVPDRVTLRGDTAMQYDADGLPSGFEPGAAATIKANAALAGEVITLGNGATLERLRIESVTGNAVAIYSRGARGPVTATIRECEVVAPGELAVGTEGPRGGGIVMLTLAAETVAARREAGPVVTARIDRSRVHAPRSGALFVTNFATAGRIQVDVAGSRLEGVTTVAGGTSRTHAVTQATTTFRSRGNLYVQDMAGVPAWQLVGGSGTTHPGSPTAPGASANTLRVESANDRIEATGAAIHASAGRRVHGMSGKASGNVLLLGLVDMTLLSGNAGADLVLQGAYADPGKATDHEFAPGDGNILRVSMHGVRGSGPRANAFSHVAGPQETADHGSGNRLEFAGRRADFLSSNPGLSPAPEPAFFPQDRSR